MIELSVEETNKLRAELGLKPLRFGNSNDEDDAGRSKSPSPSDNDNNQQQQGEEVLELSIDGTNQLRAKLGLPPLRSSTGTATTKLQDANLKEKQQQEERTQAEAEAQLEDDVQRGIQSTFTEASLGTTTEDTKSWAEKLRQQKAATTTTTTTTDHTNTKKKTKQKQKKSKSKKTDTTSTNYDEKDLKGINVAHAMSELEAGSTTVMTLADAPLLQTDENNQHLVRGLNEDANTPQLENVNLAEQAKTSDGLKKKRQLEMGMGRAGGYAGFDDDEFLELGGTGAPSRMARGQLAATNADKQQQQQRRSQGFTIGEDTNGDNAHSSKTNDLFAGASGQAISLEPSQADVQASDFMTEQEEEELRASTKASKKAKKKDKFDKKKKKKKDKKDKKKHQRRQLSEEEDESEDDTQVQKPMKNSKTTSGTKTLLEELEETAEDTTSKKSRKRNRSDDDDGDDVMEDVAAVPSTANKQLSSKAASDKKKPEDKRAKYEAIMAKGNQRTEKAFGKKQSMKEDEEMDDEADDAFLNAALAKARRLKKLREMSGAKTGADAIAEAVKSTPDAPVSSGTTTSTEGGMTFSIDDTREFTRALQARSEQQVRKQTKVAAKKDTPANTISTIKKDDKPTVETVKQEKHGDEEQEDVGMEELAKEVKQDENEYMEGTTGSTVAVGRGLSGVMNLFKQTGDFTRKNAGKEELRGRAKDERTYEDYEVVDLKDVVKMDDRYATEKDREFASREIKLEYRDKHGRLLTRKEAFRDLCYQFHGHGSSKKKEEKRLKQMEKEYAQTRMASQQVAGTDGGPGMLGALKATQKATGKAFVVHKT